MKTVLKFTVPAALLAALAIGGAPVSLAQSDEDLSQRVSRMEDQMQQLMGQVEQLTFEVRRLQGQRKTGELSEPGQPSPQKKRQVVAAQQEQGPQQDPADQGVEQIEGDTQYTQQPLRTVGDDDLPEGQVQRAPGPKILGTLSGSAYQQQNNGGSGYQADGNGEFQGQVLVPPGGGGNDDQVQGKVLVAPRNSGGGSDDQVQGRVLVPPSNSGGSQVLVPQAAADDNGGDNGDNGDGTGLMPEKVESAALGTAATASGDPEVIYERSYESLLRRQFNDAEVGFRGFLEQHRDHSLAGNAQYWLGETYYVQGDYKQAAQAFLAGYRDFPKSRKAADSLLKLGLSLNRLGQKEQACAAYMQVSSQFPKAVEARKRAQSEIKRAGC
jgi:tol-pal system protein YbgF